MGPNDLEAQQAAFKKIMLITTAFITITDGLLIMFIRERPEHPPSPVAFHKSSIKGFFELL